MSAVAEQYRGANGHRRPRPTAIPRADLTESGRIRWYRAESHYGFIIPDGDGPDVFLHASVLRKFRIRAEDCEPGARVKYAINIQGNGKPEATGIALE